MIDSCLAGRRRPWGQMRNMPKKQASPIRRLQSPNNGGERPQTMKALPVIVLVTLIPIATFASAASIGTGVGQGQVAPITAEEAIGSPDLARCQGAKCAGPGDRIRNGQDMIGSPDLAKCQGAKCAGPGDRIRNGQDIQGTQQLAGDRGGQATSGTKKGSRHHDDQSAMPVLAGSRGGQASAGTRKGSRHHDDEIGNPVRLS
jgi:general stress protein YciG